MRNSQNFCSVNGYALPKRPEKINTKLTYWYGDNEKKESDMKEKIRLSGVPETMLQTILEGLGLGALPACCPEEWVELVKCITEGRK